MELQEKINNAVTLIQSVCAKYARPVVYSSFGKDSMVMLSLIKRAGFRLPIILHREPHSPKKYAFANRVIEANDYEVYNWPPLGMQVIKENGIFDIVNRHQVGVERSDYLPIQLRAPRAGESMFHCGLKDFYLKPTGAFLFPWDVAFVGNKSADEDRILGKIELTADLQDNTAEDACSLAFPLRYFTNDDIWTYTLREKLPIHHARYDKANGWKDRDDITENPDWVVACTLCMDRDNPATVICPKTQQEIPNVSGMLNYLERPRDQVLGA